MNILFVSHESSRTGASLMLLYFLQWLKKNPQFELQVSLLTLKGGELQKDFVTEVDDFYEFHHREDSDYLSKSDKIKKLLKKINFKKEAFSKNQMIEVLAKKEFEIVYANTIISIPVAHAIKIKNNKSKLVVHVHELETQIELSLPDIRKYRGEVDAFIGVSEIVKKTLVKKYSIEEKKIKVIYGFTKSIEQRHKNNNQDFVVIGAGTVDWPKRCDLFIQVAFMMKNKYPEKEIKFKWFGKIDRQEEIILNADIEKAGLKNMVELYGEEKNLEREINKAHILLMTSREESLGLVAVEAGMLEKPVICFKGVTGFAEIVKHGGGIGVPYLDLDAMTEGIAFYYDHPDKLAEHGKKAKELCHHLTPDHQGKKIMDFILSI